MPIKLRKFINYICRHDPASMFDFAYPKRLKKIEEFKKKNPIRGFLVYTTVDWQYQMADWYWFYFYEPSLRLLRRVVSRQHLTNNGTEPGCDLDVGNAILHTSFNILVDFVEREIPRSWSNSLKYEELRKYGYAKWQVAGPMREILWRKPQYGVQLIERFLNQEYHLSQELRIAYDLYTWWTVIRPLRPQPNIAAGIRTLEEAFTAKYGPDWSVSMLEQDENLEWHARDKRERDIWQEYVDEDKEMLMKLIEHKDSIYF